DRLERAVGVELAAQPADELLDDVAVALEVLIVERVGDLGLRHDLARVQHQILEQLVLEARELERPPVYAYVLRPRVERQRPADELRLRPPAGAAHERVDAREK